MEGQGDDDCELVEEPKVEIDLLGISKETTVADPLAINAEPPTVKYLKTLEKFKQRLYASVEVPQEKTSEKHRKPKGIKILPNLNKRQCKDFGIRQSSISSNEKPKSIPTLVLDNTPQRPAVTQLLVKPEAPVLYELLTDGAPTQKLDTQKSQTHDNSSAWPLRGTRNVFTQCRVATREACVGYNGRKTVPIGFKKPISSLLDDGTDVEVLDVTEPCSCCLFRPSDKYLKTLYTDEDRSEIYSDMLEECFGIQIASEGECGICGECVVRLREARDFKLQVQRSQARLRARAGDPGQDTDMCQILVGESSAEIDSLGDEFAGQILAGEASAEIESLGDEFAGNDEAPQEEPITLPEIIVRSDGLYECDACHKTFKREASLKSHILVHYQQERRDNVDENRDSYPCDECGAEFTEKASFNEHMKTHEREIYKPLPSEETDIQEKTSDNYESSDTSEDSGSEELACHLCEKSFTLKCTYESHLKKHENPFKCDLCPREFIYEGFLAMHKSIHKRSTYICDLCKKKFHDKNLLTRHIQLHMNIKPFSCKVCEKRFKYKGSRDTHELCHIKEKNYSCGVCHKRFGHEVLLQRHEQLHKNEPCVCEQCGKQFLSEYTLEIHRRCHTGDKPFQCNICLKRYRTNGYLNIHYRSHTGLKPYQCDLCPKKFTAASYLRIHKRIHTGEKPYPCDMCDKRFVLYYQRKLHRLVHTGERPHSCGVCGKKFGRKVHLNRHLDTHKERKYYSCPHCSKVYSNKHGFRQHLRNHAKGLI